jgi:hypothetical protein
VSTVHGPYARRDEAIADCQPLAETSRTRGNAQTTAASHQRLTNALAKAGVTLGAFDRDIAAWLARWEPDTVQVVIGWVERAHASAKPAAGLASAIEVDFDAIREIQNGGGR